MLPVVHRLEEKYKDDLVVIGVHAGKFIAERKTENIRTATRRLEVPHPVVNDHQFRTWRAYNVQAWPTVVLISPDGQYIGQHSGEFSFESFDEIIGTAAQAYRAEGLLTPGALAFPPDPMPAVSSPLRFPGKVLADPSGNGLFIADTGHNRVLVANVAQDGASAQVVQTIGSGEAGFRDGSFAEAAFNHPEGLTLAENTLYIADTANHSIRAADLDTGTLATIAGTGEQGYTRTGGVGPETPLNSPWDLLESDSWLYIAMAGTHQLWRMYLPTGRVEPFVGSGRENIDDGPNLRATLAQPSGLTTDEQRLFFADSESSAVRVSDFAPDGYTQTLLGSGLFDFGDRDGKSLEVKLQHCLGVAYHHSAIYIADTYNNKIKRLDLATKECRTVLGSGQPTNLYEPGGLSVWDDGTAARLYIADTNNHRVLQSAITPEGELLPAIPVRVTFAPGAARLSADNDFVQ
ncbi:MAG: thioredoxin-like domain-containing protein [Chloroflexota bacterium]